MKWAWFSFKRTNKIIYTGLRKGEKIYEELATKNETFFIREEKNFFIIDKKNKNEKNRFKIKNSQFTKHLNIKEISNFVKKNFNT